MRNILVILLLFVLHEGFYLLPEKWIVAPGVFRMSDIFFVIVPLLGFTIFRSFSKYREESLLVFSFCGLMLLGCVIGQYFWPQTLWDGLLNVRKTFFWLSFFVYVLLLRNLDDIDRLTWSLTWWVGAYVVILLLTKYFPEMGLIHFNERYYNDLGSTMRFGEYRLFFPYGNMPALLYCMALSRLLHSDVRLRGLKKASLVTFVLVVIYAVLSTFTRAVVFPLLIVTVVAFFGSSRHALKIVATGVIFLLVCAQILSMAISESGGTFVDETKVGKMILRTGKLEAETGRTLQASMYLRQFLRSPLVGVGAFSVRGSLKNEDDVRAIYRRFGFFGASDLGFLKIIGEYGLLGLAWLVWFYVYFYRRSRQALAKATARGDVPIAKFVCRGFFYFTVYLVVSGVTLPHWVHPNGITILPLSLAMMAVIRVALKRKVEAAGGPSGYPVSIGKIAA